MVNSSVLAIGDLHGRYDLLHKVLKNVAPEAGSARLVFLGDYIDRGPDSARVIERLIKLKQARPDSIMLAGNHEKALLKLLDSHYGGYWAENFLLNGGQATLDSYGLTLKKVYNMPGSHKKFLKSLPVYWQNEDYLFVHAGLKPGVPLDRQSSQDMLTIREKFFNSGYCFKPKVVFGHTVFQKPLIKEHCLGIDTGAVYGQYLTCVLLPEMRFFKVD